MRNLSRQMSTVSLDSPGMPVRSRTRAAMSTWDSIVASSRSTQGPRRWARRTASVTASSSPTLPTYS
jgi:hypothetical protein